MSEDDPYWEWFEAELAHPDGRATGGEPCVRCGDPIHRSAHWKHRDRHVCGTRCNTSLRRKLGRQIKKGEIVPPGSSRPETADRTPLVFGSTLVDDHVHIAFLGWGPLIGDVVERFGSPVLYLEDPEGSPERALCFHPPSGSFAIVQRDEHGHVRGPVVWGTWDAAGERVPYGSDVPFIANGSEWVWDRETVRDVSASDPNNDFTWHAYICVPAGAPIGGTIWSDAYRARSEARERTSASTARHARRVRMQDSAGAIERIDPAAIYERDQWTCRLCGRPVNRECRHPDYDSPSLDHVIPLAAGGTHTGDNVQLAHLICNIRKGARGFDVVPPRL